jgi:type I restriction enzyme M protein
MSCSRAAPARPFANASSTIATSIPCCACPPVFSTPSETPWTRTLWIYDLRTNQHFTLKTNTLTRADLDDFVRCYNPANRHQRTETERFRCFSYEDLVKRDKANLDIFWLRDDSLGDSSDLPDPAVLAAEIVEDLQAALDQFAQIVADLGVGERDTGPG